MTFKFILLSQRATLKEKNIMLPLWNIFFPFIVAVFMKTGVLVETDSIVLNLFLVI